MSSEYERWLIARGNVFSPSADAIVKLVTKLRAAKWIVDQYGRPGFTEVSKQGYRPSPEDGQAFMQELSMQLQKRGF